ncbi:MAG TPA: GNAT family N-acetyltransferase [Myxococcales bacterium]|nr:GNAT family N-acetyltransferase [Myxococcales bacterium]
MNDPEIRELDAAEVERRLSELAEVLVDVVDGGASVNFLRGFTAEAAEGFWRSQLPALQAGTRRLLIAEAGGRLVGTVVVTFAHQPNQPHRAEISKMLVHRSCRRHGFGARLLSAAEATAERHGRTLLVLDTESGSAGERLYSRSGWVKIGEIPGYALSPDGVPKAASFFYKQLPAPAR